MNQLNAPAPALEAFHRHFVLQAGHDDLAATNLLGVMDGQEIAVENAGAGHAVAPDLKQVVRAG